MQGSNSFCTQIEGHTTDGEKMEGTKKVAVIIHSLFELAKGNKNLVSSKKLNGQVHKVVLML